MFLNCKTLNIHYYPAVLDDNIAHLPSFNHEPCKQPLPQNSMETNPYYKRKISYPKK